MLIPSYESHILHVAPSENHILYVAPSENHILHVTPSEKKNHAVEISENTFLVLDLLLDAFKRTLQHI
jgi:hypothetical protein